MQRAERQDDQVAAFQLAMESVGLNLRVACPAIVESYDAEAMTIVAQPVGQEAYRTPQGTTQSGSLPQLVDVPVVFPRGGPFTLTYPVAKGDECLIVFADRCIDAWWQSGDVQPQAEARMHDLSDAIAIVGPFSQATKIAKPHTENVQLRHNDGDCWIEITPEKNINTETPGKGKWHFGGLLEIQSDTEILMNAPHIGLND